MNCVLFSLIQEKHLYDVLETLSHFLSVSTFLINADGTLISCWKDNPAICPNICSMAEQKSACFNIRCRSAELAQTLGESYIFNCHADLTNIIFPFVFGGEIIASVLAGPFRIETAQGETEDGELQVPVLSAQQVQKMKKLMDHMLSSLLMSERALLLTSQQKMLQQAKINDIILRDKGSFAEESPQRYIELESALLVQVSAGNAKEAQDCLNRLFAYLIEVSGTSIESLRLRAVELVTLITRTAVRTSALQTSVLPLCDQYDHALQSAAGMDEICYLVKELLDNCLLHLCDEAYRSNPYIKKALSYISAHYSQPLTVISVSKEVGLSPNHFSMLFQKAVGMKFSDYLCRMRVEESKLLLLSSDYSLSDIAVSMGFSDQSYFSKVFKKIVGLPPGQYRSGKGE